MNLRAFCGPVEEKNARYDCKTAETTLQYDEAPSDYCGQKILSNPPPRARRRHTGDLTQDLHTKLHTIIYPLFIYLLTFLHII